MASLGTANSSISVAVRVRPFNTKEQALLSSTYNAGPTFFSSDPSASSSSSPHFFSTPQPPRNGANTGSLRKVLKVLDERILVFDPPENNSVVSVQKQVLPVMGKKVKDIRFCFDRVFDEDCGQEEVYDGSAKELVGHVMNGFHSTVFAYGATGCGKTHTISGSNSQPGIVFLIMKDLFARIAQRSGDTDFSITISYLEIYNETIRDLLAPESGPLALRENNGTASPAGLSTKVPSCATEVVEWITLGNQNRTVNATEANATSSRSHAVLTVTLAQRARGTGMTDTQQTACLSVIDLAGSERASNTKNKGDRLIEGANINRSLLALGNCINALCDPRKRGHVPYRDSKLTRLLKQSLGGNCKTVMIVCVSPSSAHYDETHNTLQYANRAKEIKTKAVRNVISVDRHVAQYCQQILEQAQQIDLLKAQLAKQETVASAADREDDLRAVARAKKRLVGTWEEGKHRLVQRESARTEHAVIDNILDVLQQWRTDVLSCLEGTSPASKAAASSTITQIQAAWDTLANALQATSRRLIDVSNAGDRALDMYQHMQSSTCGTLTKEHPGALPLFSLETKVLDATLESELAAAREAGLVEGMKVQARAMLAMSDARMKVGGALDLAREEASDSEHALRRLSDGIDSANRAAFLALAQSFTATGKKRDQGARSPFEPQEGWAKVPRAAVTGVGSSPSGHLASPARTYATTIRRQSPRKPVAFQARRADGSASPKKKAKGVQWRDEETSQELEDVRWQSPASFDSETLDSTPTASTSSGPPLVHVSAPPAWPAPSSSSSAAVASAAERMSSVIKQRSATGPLKRHASTSRLAPLAEHGKPFSFARDNGLMLPPPVPGSSLSTGTPFSDVGNTSTSSTSSSTSSRYSMAGPSGLFAPLVSKPTTTEPDTPRRAARAARRTSQIGPLRSTKSNRRTSFIAPPTPAGTSFKASRFGAAPASSAPMSARRSPRKVGPTSLRRGSLAIGGGSAPTFIPGQRSAERIKARRESAMAAISAVGAPSTTATARKGSPSLTAPLAKPGLWR